MTGRDEYYLLHGSTPYNAEELVTASTLEEIEAFIEEKNGDAFEPQDVEFEETEDEVIARFNRRVGGD